MRRLTFHCWPYGHPTEFLSIRANSRAQARSLAAFQLRIHQDRVAVELAPVR